MTDALHRVARLLNDRAAEACNVDRNDSWSVYSQTYRDDAAAILEALAAMGYALTPPPVAQPVAPASEAVRLHVGDSSFEQWFGSYASIAASLKQMMRDAYAAGMADPLVSTPQTEPVPASAGLLQLVETFSTWARQVSERKDVPQRIREAGAKLHVEANAALAQAAPQNGGAA